MKGKQEESEEIQKVRKGKSGKEMVGGDSQFKQSKVATTDAILQALADIHLMTELPHAIVHEPRGSQKTFMQENFGPIFRSLWFFSSDSSTARRLSSVLLCAA